MAGHFGNPGDMRGYWPEFYNKLTSMPTCEGCTKAQIEAEALEICNAVWDAMDTLSGINGCIFTSSHVFTALCGIPGANVKTDDVEGANWFHTTTSRLTWEITLKCFTITNVARWTGFFRHQAVLVIPRCAPDFSRLDNLVIDLWWLRGGLVTPTPFFERYETWAGGAASIGKTSGPVSAGF